MFCRFPGELTNWPVALQLGCRIKEDFSTSPRRPFGKGPCCGVLETSFRGEDTGLPDIDPGVPGVPLPEKYLEIKYKIYIFRNKITETELKILSMCYH